MDARKTLQVEQRSIDLVPQDERYGTARELFLLWFSCNANPLTIATGAIAVALGLPLGWAIAAAVIGHCIGGVFMALHSAQGPILGIPQMIQSRAQFGYRGAVLPLVLVVLMYIGYLASGAVLVANALASVAGIGVDLAIVLTNVGAALIAIYGYHLLRAWVNVIAWVAALVFMVLSVGFLLRSDFSAVAPGEFSWGTFLLAVTVSATWQLTYAPYVADYSRYLPADTSVRASFWWTYAGSVISSIWMFAFGAGLAAVAPEAFAGGSVDVIAAQAGFGTTLFLCAILLATLPILGVEVYGAFMSTTTITSSLTDSGTVSQRARVLSISLLTAVATLLAVLGRGDFLNNLVNFIILLALFLVPWTAINLVDFYLVRKERYDVLAIFARNGRYKGTDWRAMTAYLLGVAVEIPFVSTAPYTGPFVDDLGGADISWVLGLVVSSVVYYALMTRYPVRHGYGLVSNDEPEPGQRRTSSTKADSQDSVRLS